MIPPGHRRQAIPLPVSKPKYKYQHPRPRPRPPRPRPPPPPPPQPTPYQVRMGSTLGPLNTRIAQISGWEDRARLRSNSKIIINNIFRSVMDPYAILALLGFLVFLFYIIYNFINNSGDGRSFSESYASVVNHLCDLISDSLSSYSSAPGKLSQHKL